MAVVTHQSRLKRKANSLAFNWLWWGAWISAATPSSAFFFQAAEQYVTQIFNGAAGEPGRSRCHYADSTVIRYSACHFVIYIGIALVRVISAFRNDEDWSTAARIPLITVLCIVIGDALSSLIVQGAGAANRFGVAGCRESTLHRSIFCFLGECNAMSTGSIKPTGLFP